MAFKFTVDYQQIKLVIQTDSTEAVSLFEHLKTTVQFIDMQQIVAFQQLTAADVFIDADTLNRYFTAQYNSPNAESFGFTDSDVFDFSKASSDTPIVSEELAKALDKALADSTSVAEELSKTVQYFRELADSYSFSDSEVLSVGLGKADTTTISESDAKDVGKAVDDASATDQTFTVTVQSYYGANKYYINGVRQDTLTLRVGATYTFDQSDSSNSSHPLRLSTTSNGTHGGGSAYTTNVTTNGTAGSSGAYTRIVVTGSTPSTLYYYCTNHSAMGGQINVGAAGDMLMLDVPAKSFERPLSDAPNIAESLARAVTYQRTFTDAYALDDLASAEDNLATESGLNKSNVFSVTDVPVFSITKPAITDTITISESLSFNFVGENSAFADTFSLSDSPSLATGPVDPFADTPSISESLGLSFATSFTDSATITESVEILFVAGGGSVLNTAGLNTSVLN